MKQLKRCALCATAMIALAPSLAQAQTQTEPGPAVQEPATSDEMADIVVTGARQRREAAQSAPVAVSVLTPAMLTATSAPNIQGLSSLVPNLNIIASNSVPGLAVITLRGFNNNTSDISAEPAVAVYIDGVYQTLSPGSFADLFDLQSIEVLRGPQGTLLGRNAPAGAILLNRSRPTGELGLKARIEYGSHNLAQAQALVNFPIVKDVLSAKIYTLYRYRDSYIKNLSFPGDDQGGERKGTFRGALLFTPSTDLSVYLTGEYSWDRSQQKSNRNVSTAPNPTCSVLRRCYDTQDPPLTTRSDFTPRIRQDDYSATMVADWNVGPISFKSTTGYRNYKQINNIDIDGTDTIVLHSYDQPLRLKSFSEEFRINSTEGGGADLGGLLNWVVGFYYSDSDSYAGTARRAFNGATVSLRAQSVKRTNLAAFGQADINITDSLTASFGARRASDKFVHRFALATPVPAATNYPNVIAFPSLPNREQIKFTSSSFEAGARYKFDRDKLVYFRYSEGYRPGGFNGEPATLNNPPFPAESSASYEIGAKTEWFDRRLRINLTLFDIKFKNLQRSIAQEQNGSLVQRTGTAQARTKGVELETVLIPVKGLNIRGNLGYLDAKYSDFVIDIGNGQTLDASGQQLGLTSKWTGGVSADYRIALPGNGIGGFDAVTLYAAANGRSRYNSSQVNAPLGKQKGYVSVDGSITFSTPDDRLEFQVYVNNAFDKRWIEMTNDLVGLTQFVQDNMGRLWGASATLKF